MTRPIDFRRATPEHLEHYAARLVAVAEMLRTNGRHIQGAILTAAEPGFPAKASGADSDGGGGGGDGSAVEAAVLRPDRVAESARRQIGTLSVFLPLVDEVERALSAYMSDPGKRGTLEVCGRCGEPMEGRARCQSKKSGSQCLGLPAGQSEPECSAGCGRSAAPGRGTCHPCRPPKANTKRGHHTVEDYRDMTGVIAVDEVKP